MGNAMMRTARMLAVSGAFCANLFLFSGCCSHRRAGMEFELLHQEMRQMEDYIYHLEDELAHATNRLNQLGDENNSASPDGLPSSVLHETDRATSPPIDPPTHQDNENVRMVPNIELGGDFNLQPPTETNAADGLPSVNLPTNANPIEPQDDTESAAPGANSDFPDDLEDIDSELDELLDSGESDLLPDGANRDHPRQQEMVAEQPIDPHITHIVFNDRRTGGADLDGSPGDEGITVVVEPRNANGQFVPLAGPMTVVVLDPQMKGEDARVARWEVESTDASRSLFEIGPNRGIYLELPWQHAPPQHSRVHVFARYETVDGRRLVADQQITIERQDDISSRWTPSTRFSRQQRRLNNMRDQLADDVIGHPVESNESAEEELIAENPATEQAPHQVESLDRPPAPASPLPSETPRVSDRPRAPTWRPYR